MFRPLLRTLPSLSGNVKLVCDVNIDNNSNNIINNNACFTGEVKSACLMPVSSDVFKKKIPVNMLSSSYDYDLKQFYDVYSDIFYKSQYRFNKNEIEILDKANPVNERDKDFEYGCSRSSYKYGQYQYEFFAPVYIDNINDLPDKFRIQCIFEFENYKVERDIDIKINAGNIYESTNYLYNYLYKYISTIDNKAVKLAYDGHASGTGTYWGIDLLHGGQTVSEDIQVADLFNSQCTLQNFDNVINEGFKRNKMAMRQVIPFCFRFNLADTLTDQELAVAELCWLDISGKWIKDSTDNIDTTNFSSDLWDFDINYDELYNKIDIYDSDACNIKKAYNYKYNIMDQGFPGLHDANFIKYQFVNRISPNINRWMLSVSDDNDPYIINNSQLYSINQDSYYKYRYFPEQLKFNSTLSVICNTTKQTTKNDIYNPDKQSDYNISLDSHNIYNFILPSTEKYYISRENLSLKGIDNSKAEIYYNDGRLFNYDNYKLFIMNHISGCCTPVYISNNILKNDIYENDRFNTILDISTDYINNIINSKVGSLTCDPNASVSIFDKKNNIYYNKIWKTPVNDYVYYNDMLYNLQMLYNSTEIDTDDKITKFGVFILPITKIISSKDISQYVSCDFIMQFLPDTTDNDINVNTDIETSEISIDYITDRKYTGSGSDNINYYDTVSTLNNENINTKLKPYSGLLSYYINKEDKDKYNEQITLKDIYEGYSGYVKYDSSSTLSYICDDKINYENIYINTADLVRTFVTADTDRYIDPSVFVSYIDSIQENIINDISSKYSWTNYAYLNIKCENTDTLYNINIKALFDNIRTIYYSGQDDKLPDYIKTYINNGYDNFGEYYTYVITDSNLWLWCQRTVIDEYNRNNIFINDYNKTILDVSDSMFLNDSSVINNTYCLMQSADIYKLNGIYNYSSYMSGMKSIYGHIDSIKGNDKYYNIIKDYNINLYNNIQNGDSISYSNNRLYRHTLYNKKSLIKVTDINRIWSENRIYGINNSNPVDIYKYAKKHNIYTFSDSVYGNNIISIIGNITSWLNSYVSINDGDDTENTTLFKWLYDNIKAFRIWIDEQTRGHAIDFSVTGADIISYNGTPSGLLGTDQYDIDNNYILYYKNNITDIFRHSSNYTNIIPNNIISYIDSNDIFNDIYRFNPYLYYNSTLINNNIFSNIGSGIHHNPICDIPDDETRYLWTDVFNINKICDDETKGITENEYTVMKEFFCDFISARHVEKYLCDICRDENNKYIPDDPSVSYNRWIGTPCHYNVKDIKKGPFDFLFVVNKTFIIDDINYTDNIIRYKYISFYNYIYNKITDYIYNKYKNEYNNEYNGDTVRDKSYIGNYVDDYLSNYYISTLAHNISETNNGSYFNIDIKLNIKIILSGNIIELDDTISLTDVHLVYRKKFIKVNKYLLDKYTTLLGNDDSDNDSNNTNNIKESDRPEINFFFSYKMSELDFDEENNSVDNGYDIDLLSDIKKKQADGMAGFILTKTAGLLKPLYDDIYNKNKLTTVIYNNLKMNSVRLKDNGGSDSNKNSMTVYLTYNTNTADIMLKVNKPFIGHLEYFLGSKFNDYLNLSASSIKVYKLYSEQCELLSPLSSSNNDNDNDNNDNNNYVFNDLKLDRFNIFTYKDKFTGEVYGFYIITVPLTNTGITFNTIYNTDIDIDKSGQYGKVINTTRKTVSMFDGFEDYPLFMYDSSKQQYSNVNYTAINYFNTKLDQIIPLSNINPLSEVFKIPLLEPPVMLSIKHRYNTVDINDSNTNNGNINERNIIYTLKENNIKPVYDNINIIKESNLTRYFNYIRPVLKNVYELERDNMFDYIYNTKRKTTKSILLKTGKYTSIGDSVIYKYKDCGINKYKPVSVYSDTECGQCNEKEYGLSLYYNNVIYNWTEPEYKHFNCSKLNLLPVSIEIPDDNKYTYREVLGLSDNNIIYNKFRDYIISRLKKTFRINHELFRKKMLTEDEILFLYNRYDSTVTSKWTGLNKEKTEKTYTVTYKYTLK